MGVDIDPNGTVNPARAGMIRAGAPSWAGCARKPRASGDDPPEYCLSAVKLK